MHRNLLKAVGLFLLMAAWTTGCHYVDINYIGKTYPPTQDVEMYFDREDVPKDYRVIGRAIVTAPQGTKGPKVKEELMKEARLKGAEALLVGPAKQYLASTSTNYDWDYYGGPGWAWGDPYGWGYGPGGGMYGPPVAFGMGTASDPQTTYNYAFKMKIIFLRKAGDM